MTGKYGTLGEYLEKNGIEDTVFYIGLKNTKRLRLITQPSGYIFIGTKGEWERDKEMLSEHWKTLLANSIASTRGDLMRMIAKGVPQRGKNESEGDYFLTLTQYGKSLAAAAKRIPAFEDALKHWDTFSDRPVVEVYKKRDPTEPGIVVLAEGVFAGAHWFKAEYQAFIDAQKEATTKFVEVPDD